MTRGPAAVLLLTLLLPAGAHAHRASDAFLTLAVDGARVHGQWEVALRDLAVLAPVDANGDRALTWGELLRTEHELRQALARALAVTGDGAPCALSVGEVFVHDRSDGRYGWFALSAMCPHAPTSLRLDYGLLFELDPSHRGLLALSAGAAVHSAVFEPARASVALQLAAPSHLRLFTDYFREGVHHIWIGLDHVLFLLALLLPCVLQRRAGAWHPAPALRPVLWDVIRIVTAFTLAHSVTLTLSALGLVRLPAALTEWVIAASVLLAALNNLRPVVTKARWGVAAVFGLVHGFGFASVLGELGLPPTARALALLAFNLGVETGQLAIVLVAVPLAFTLRRTRAYPAFLKGGSLLIVALALFWLLERSGLLIL